MAERSDEEKLPSSPGTESSGWGARRARSEEPEPTLEGKTSDGVTVTVRLTPEEHSKAARIAADTGCSFEEAVRQVWSERASSAKLSRHSAMPHPRTTEPTTTTSSRRPEAATDDDRHPPQYLLVALSVAVMLLISGLIVVFVIAAIRSVQPPGQRGTPSPMATATTPAALAVTVMPATPTVVVSEVVSPTLSAPGVTPTVVRTDPPASPSPSPAPPPALTPILTPASALAAETPPPAGSPSATPTAASKGVSVDLLSTMVTHTYVFPIDPPAAAVFQNGHHDYPAADLFAKPGTQVVAVTGGFIHELGPADEWNPTTDDPAARGGIYVSLVGFDGMRYYYSHLKELAEGLQLQMVVKPGQLLGYVGDSGNARGLPQLHFGISRPSLAGDWARRRGEINPYPYLVAWLKGEDLAPKSNP